MILASQAKAQWGDPPTPAEGDPDAPVWPAQERYRLWPGKAPGEPASLPRLNATMNGPRGGRELWLRGIAVPEIHVFRPARPDGSAILSLPGGGYRFLSVQNEGLDVAQKFTADRTTVFVLTYRLPDEGWENRHLVPLQDAQRAVRIIRHRAKEFAIDPNRLGVLGFSAGGHLAADLAVSHDERTYTPVDAADSQSARPTWLGLVYPVTSLMPLAGKNVLVPNASDPMLKVRSPVLHVTEKTPPTFIVHAFDDSVVPMDHSLDWIAACRAKKVPVEAHLLTAGGHGFGLHLAKDMPGALWPDQLSLWMRKL